MSDNEKKIIIDEDWKDQVQAEKDAARAAAEADTSAPEATEAAPADDLQSDMPMGEIPPASFSFLVTTLASQTMIALGAVPNPMTGNIDVHLPGAKHFIDMLGVLEEKTKGNLSADEAELLNSALVQLRIGYVERQKQGK